jgi:hypothetical protein
MASMIAETRRIAMPSGVLLRVHHVALSPSSFRCTRKLGQCVTHDMAVKTLTGYDPSLDNDRPGRGRVEDRLIRCDAVPDDGGPHCRLR